MKKRFCTTWLLTITVMVSIAYASDKKPLLNDYEIPLQSDNANVYLFEKEVVPGADPKSFQPIKPRSAEKKGPTVEGIYFRDEDQVFFFDGFSEFKFIPIAGADPTSFENLGSFFGKDKNYAYYHSEVIKDADPKSFRPLVKEALRKDSGFELMGYPFSRDTKAVFYGNRKIPNADPASFEIISITAAKDKNRSYQFPKSLGKLDPK